MRRDFLSMVLVILSFDNSIKFQVLFKLGIDISSIDQWGGSIKIPTNQGRRQELNFVVLTSPLSTVSLSPLLTDPYCACAVRLWGVPWFWFHHGQLRAPQLFTDPQPKRCKENILCLKIFQV